MSHLWVFYGETYQFHTFHDGLSSISVGNDLSHTITIKKFLLPNGQIDLMVNDEKSGFIVQSGGKEIGKLKSLEPLFINISNEKPLTFVYSLKPLEKHIYYIENQHEIFFSTSDETAQIQKANSFLFNEEETFSLMRNKGQWFAYPDEKSPLYLNGERIVEPQSIYNGDVLLWSGLFISIIEGDLLEIKANEQYRTQLQTVSLPTTEKKKKYPEYRRTPRMVYDLPEDKVTLSFPHQESDNYQRGLWLVILPPLVMLLVMGAIAILQPRGIFMLISVVMFGTTLITSTVQYFKEKGNRKRRSEKRRRLYNEYLERKRKELQHLADEQRKILYYHFPSFERLKYLALQINERIWERTMESGDFLHVRIGRANVPSSFEVSVGSEDSANREIDDLVESFQQMVDVYRTVKNVPLSIDLSSGSIGLVGKLSIVKNEIHQIIGQLAFFHSYHDVRFVAIFHEEEYKNWEWMKWLPHFQLPHVYAKGLIYNEQTRDQLLTSIYEILRERDMDPDKKKKSFRPHFVFIITNRQLISEHVILEYLDGKDQQIGLSTIFATDSKESLTENIHTLVRYVNEHEGDILIEKSKAVHTPFWLDEHVRENNERFARALQSLDHQLGLNNSIPTKVSFLELFSVKEVEDLNIQQKWMSNLSSKSLSVPIGLKGRDDVVELNLHEKAHGPHGLLAGTTGSGKSEFLQTYILSLAVHFHPHDVAFLLIDYKGGGMAQPFKNMPHLLGTITNIEGSKNFSNRALASIKSELKRRQRLFDRYEVNHIHDYTELYRNGKAEEPLPHLFLISDEFAELKREEPEFIRELVSAARIGRSLGVHLILATQKPGGVVDDQIWSNARFKVCLKVQDANDSKEILKNADAANITVTGRGYLQVGNNEVYELFQSAWSGAPYLEDTFSSEDEIAIVTDLGFIPLSNVSGVQTTNKEKKTEIEAVVKHIEEVQHAMQIQKLRSPWLPPLGHRLVRKSTDALPNDRFIIGLKDEPEKQLQDDYVYQLIEDGNIAVFGSSGYGKSITLLSLLLQFAHKLSPEEIHYYIFDFGNGALLPIRQLPHTGDYFRMDDERKIEKFLKFLKDEMDKRKQLFEEKEISNIKLYNSNNEKKLPLIFITIDNFDLVKEEFQDLETQFIQLSRDGQSLGIYMIFTATRVNSIRQSLLNNLKTKIVHYLMDQSESYSLLGRLEYEMEPIPGRAIVKKDEAYLMQVYLPSEGKDDMEVLENVKREVSALKVKYEGMSRPKSIPMLPKKLVIHEFLTNVSHTINETVIPLGLDEETVSPVYLNLAKNRHCIIIGQSQKGKTNLLKVILNSQLAKTTKHIGIFDGIDRGLSAYSKRSNITYLESRETISGWMNEMNGIFQQREKEYVHALESNDLDSLAFSPILLLIDSISRFQQIVDSVIQGQLAMFMKQYSHLGFSVIVAGGANEFSKGFDSFTNELKQIRQGFVLMKKSDQSFFTLPYVRKEPEIEPGFGYFVENGTERKIQIPLC